MMNNRTFFKQLWEQIPSNCTTKLEILLLPTRDGMNVSIVVFQFLFRPQRQVNCNWRTSDVNQFTEQPFIFRARGNVQNIGTRVQKRVVFVHDQQIFVSQETDSDVCRRVDLNSKMIIMATKLIAHLHIQYTSRQPAK